MSEEEEPEQPASDKGQEADEVLDLVGQRDTRRMLAYARLEPMSAQELADRCEMSLPTAYRRANTLLDRGLLSEQMQIDRNGNHYRTFETDVDRISMLIREGAFGVGVQFQRDIVDKFEQFWQELANAPID